MRNDIVPGIRTYSGSATGKEPAPVLQSNRAARVRAAVFPGGQVRPSQIPLGKGAPGCRERGEQVVIRAGMGRAPSMQPGGAPGSVSGKPLGPARMRPGGFGATGGAPRQHPEARNGQRAAQINGAAQTLGGPMERPYLWAGAALLLFLVLRRRK